MRNFALIILAAFIGHSAFSQGGMTLYNMSYIPQASYLNPANTPQTNFYLSLPVISGVGAGLNNNFFSLQDVGINLNARWDEGYADSLLTSFSRVAQLSNSLGLKGNLDWLGFGLRSGRQYVSFYIQEEIQANLDFPDELFRFLDDYQKDVVGPNTPYLMSGSRMGLSQYRSFNLQYAYDVSPALTLGGKASYISGIYTLDMSNDTLIAVPGDNSKGFDIVGRMNIRTGGFIEADTANIKNVFINPQNSGFALGFGGKLTTLEDRLDIQFSAINLGQIFWNQKVGLTELTDESFKNADSLQQIFDTLFRVNERPNFSFRQNLIPEFYLGANYYLSKGTSVGALLRARPVYETIQSSFGLFFNARAGKWLGFSTGYMYADRAHNIPFGLTLQPGPVQLYVVTDNILGFAAPSTARQFHLNVGLNLTFGKTSRHWPEKEAVSVAPPPVYLPQPVEEEDDYFGFVEPDAPATTRDTIQSPSAGQAPLYRDDESDVTTYLVSNPIFLHRGPAGSTTVLDTIQPNTVITVLQKRLPDWWYVEFGDKSGWIQPRSIRPALELPVAESAESEEPAQPARLFTPQEYIMLDQTAMRTEPSEEAREVHRVQKWEEVLVLEKTNSSWWKIRHDGYVGFVKSAMLNPRPENYVRPEAGAPVVRPSAPAPTPTPRPQSNLGIYTLNESTSLRAEATHESRSIMRLRKGMKVNVLEKTSSLWWKVEVNGLIGYAKAGNLVSE
jgi:uncharacterized protein YgiM (DUF1202 family)